VISTDEKSQLPTLSRCHPGLPPAPGRPGRVEFDRMAAAWPNAVLMHLPVHASWLNQVEVVFSIIQCKVIKPVGFEIAEALAARLLAFQSRYNTTPRRRLTGSSPAPS
jgi:hypothetical protein